MSSHYYSVLNDDCKKRYIEKLTFKDFQLPDPLDEDLRKKVYTSKLCPNINVFDIYSYLVKKHKMYSKLAFKDYPSLPCYNYVLSGKVKGMKCYQNKIGVYVVIADVEASLEAKENYLPWIISTPDGEIVSGHCTCTAGLEETCLHIGATLFFIEKTVRDKREKPAYISKPYKSKRTSRMDDPLPISEIDFTNPKQRNPNLCKKQARNKKEFTNTLSMTDSEFKLCLPISEIDFTSPKQRKKNLRKKQAQKKKELTIVPPTDSEIKLFLRKLKKVSPDAAILTLYPDIEPIDSAEDTDCANAS